jgi:hypothetical protein
MNTRRHAFALAGVLTATALTGAVAIAGFSNHSTATPTIPQTAVVQVAPSPASPAHAWADD